jgi:hypothetical protein
MTTCTYLCDHELQFAGKLIKHCGFGYINGGAIFWDWKWLEFAWNGYSKMGQ